MAQKRPKSDPCPTDYTSRKYIYKAALTFDSKTAEYSKIFIKEKPKSGLEMDS